MRIYKQLGILCAAGAMLSACSHDEKPTPAHFSVSTTEVSLTKKGVDMNNRNFILSVTADTYWVAFPEDDSWLRLSTRAGAAGETRIELSADENLSAASRETSIRFETAEAVVSTVRVREAGTGEMLVFLYDGFGTAQSAAIPLSQHDKTAEGFSADDVSYSGTECSIAPTPASAGYDGASGGCHALLHGEGSSLRIDGLQPFGDTGFRLSFGVCAEQAFDCRKLVLSIRMDGGEWMLVPYTLDGGWSAGWKRVSVNLMLTEAYTTLALQFGAAADGDYRLDDILLQETVLDSDDFYYTDGDLEHFGSEEWKWDDPSHSAEGNGTENFEQEDYDWK